MAEHGIVAIGESEKRHHKCDARRVKTQGALSQFAFSTPLLFRYRNGVGGGQAGHLFHTYLRALGLKPSGKFKIGGRKYPMADPAFEPIREILA